MQSCNHATMQSAIYIHIPFCKQACYYCDFHFSTNQNLKENLIKAICKEISLQKYYFDSRLKTRRHQTPDTNHQIDTIYLGGGTPSLLSENEIDQILNTITKYFKLNDSIEITMEANPEDLTNEKLKLLHRAGINRLSIGIQSFDDNQLKFLNRAHNALDAKKSIELAQNAGFDNINIDLIYGIKLRAQSAERKAFNAMRSQILEKDLETTFKLQIQHISAYCLTIEPKTVFGNWVEKKKMKPVDEDFATRQYEILIALIKKNGFLQYEISNFCLPGYESKQLCNYWTQGKYLGIGPSAHSYNGTSRQFNISNNAIYIRNLIHCNRNKIRNSNSQLPIWYRREKLNLKDKANEYILTRLKTTWGLPLKKLKTTFNYDLLTINKTYINNYLKAGVIILENDHIKLTDKGMFLADKIISELMK